MGTQRATVAIDEIAESNSNLMSARNPNRKSRAKAGRGFGHYSPKKTKELCLSKVYPSKKIKRVTPKVIRCSQSMRFVPLNARVAGNVCSLY